MQDNKNLHAFDNDILQCKADILRALGGSDQIPPIEAAAATPPNIKDTLSPEESDLEIDFLEAELSEVTQADVVPASALTADAAASSIVISPVVKELPPSPDVLISDVDDLQNTPAFDTPVLERPIVPENLVADSQAGPEETADELIAVEEDEPIDLSHIDSEEIHAENAELKKAQEQLRRQLLHEQTEKSKMIDQLRALSEAIEPLRTSNQQMEQRLNELILQGQTSARQSQDAQQMLAESLEQEKASCAAAKERLQSMQNELQKIQKARDFLSESFSAVSEQNQVLQSQIERLSQEQIQLTAKAHEQIEELTRQKQELEDRRRQSETECALLNSALDGFNRRYQDATSERDALLQRIETAVQESKAEGARLNDALNDSNRRCQETTLERDQLMQRLETIAQESAVREKEAQHLAGERQQLIDQTAKMKDQLQQFQLREVEWRSIASQNQSLRQELSETEASLGQQQATIRQLEAQLDALRQENSSAAMKLHQLEETDEHMQQQEELLKQATQAVQATYAKYRENAEQEIAEQDHRIQMLLGQTQRLDAQIRNDRLEFEKLSGSLQEMTAAKDYMQQELENRCQREKELLADCRRLDDELAGRTGDYQQTLSRLQADLSALEQQAREKNAEIENIQRQTHDKNAEIESLRQQIERLNTEMRLRDELDQPSRAPQKPADERLEVMLEPEELSALMTPADEEASVPCFAASAEDTIVEPLMNAVADGKDAAAEQQFNLADLILSEHRRSTSVRRRRIEESAGAPAARGIKQVVEQYVRPSLPPQPAKTGGRRMWEDDFLTPFQRELLQEVIQRDIERLGEKYVRGGQRGTRF